MQQILDIGMCLDMTEGVVEQNRHCRLCEMRDTAPAMMTEERETQCLVDVILKTPIGPNGWDGHDLLPTLCA